MLEWSKEMTGAGQDTGAEKRRPLSKSLRFDVFLDQETFKQAGAYWGDLRADRRNPAFIQA